MGNSHSFDLNGLMGNSQISNLPDRNHIDKVKQRQVNKNDSETGN